MDKKPHGKVLIVDDDIMIRSLLKVILRSENWDLVGEAIDGEQAVAMCKALDPDIVCLDVMMPGISGVDTLKVMRKECPEVRVVMITSDASTATVREAVSFGAMGYIIKPFNAKRVADALHQAMKATPEGGIG